jgi:hypothetical protein
MITPCKHICKYNENKICIGCKRNSEEISNWLNYSDIERLEIIKKIKTRNL